MKFYSNLFEAEPGWKNQNGVKSGACTCGGEKHLDTLFLLECQPNHIRQIVDMN